MSGNLWKFSDQLDAVDAIMIQKVKLVLCTRSEKWSASGGIFWRNTCAAFN